MLQAPESRRLKASHLQPHILLFVQLLARPALLPAPLPLRAAPAGAALRHSGVPLLGCSAAQSIHAVATPAAEALPFCTLP